MTTLIEANTIIIVISLLVGLAVGWWIFKTVRSDARESDHRSEVVQPPKVLEVDRPVRAGTDGREGNSIVDQGAAATTDVAGQVLDIPVHQELPGASGPPDNLEIMKGVGPKFVTKLHENGIIRFDQIARLSANEIAILDEKMGPFKGRLTRDRVVEQASYLARDDRDGYEAKFGKLGPA